MTMRNKERERKKESKKERKRGTVAPTWPEEEFSEGIT